MIRSMLGGGIVLAFAVGTASGQFYSGDGFTGSLVLTNADDGSSTVVGDMGLNHSTGMAYNAVTDTLYTRSGGSLYTVNRQTADVTFVGSDFEFLVGLAFRGSAYSTLYAIQPGSQSQLFAISAATGEANLVGFTFIPVVSDVASDREGTMYAATASGRLYTFDPFTAVATPLFGGASLDPRGLDAIGFDSDDTMFGVTSTGDMFVRIDRETGQVTDIGGPLPIGAAAGLAFAPAPATLGLLGAGLIAASRRGR